MSFLLDDTAVQEPVKDISQPLRAAQDVHNARVRVDVSRVSRKELEDNFLQLHDESLLLKQHIHQQEDKIRKLGTKLLRLVKDRRRMEQLAGGGGAPMVPRRWDAEKEDLVDEFKEKVRALETDNDKLRQRLFVAKQQQQLIALSPAARSSHTRVQTRAASAPRKPDDASSPSPTPPRRARSAAGDERPPSGQPTAYLHALLEEAREKSRNLENVIESQQRRIAQLEEEKNVTLQQQNKSELRSQINNNVTMIKLQKQLAERCNAMVELEERFLQLQESQHTQKACYDAATAKMAELTSQLRDERAKSVELRTQLQTEQLSHAKMRQLEERVDEVEQEKELLKEHNEKLLNSMLDGSQQQRWSVQERQLQQHIAQLEQALQGDLQDKKKILEEVKAERDACENLTEENRKLVHQLAEKKREIEELQRRVDAYSRTDDYDGEKLTEALLLIKAQKSQQSGELGFLQEGQDGGMREHADAHVETIHELEKVRQLLAVESRISSDLKVELDSVQKKMECDKRSHTQQLEHQAQMMAAKDAKMHKLEAQLRDVAYGAKSVSAQDRDQSPALEDGENLVELQIIGATLSAAALEALGDPAPSTFCTYAFYLFDLHATPVATGPTPHYGFTSQYVVSVDRGFLEYVRERRLCVEMHQALGLRWKTMATAALDLRRLLRDGAAAGTLPLVGNYGEDTSFGSLEYWIKLRNPIAESDRLVVVGSHDEQMAAGVEKELLVEVRGCSGLQSRCSSLPSPYVVYKLFHFPDYPTSTVHDCCQPRFADMKSFRLADDGALEHYLASEALNLYVFDYKEPQMDEYLGKAAVPLAALLQDQEIAGTFDLHDSSGRHVGHIDLAIKWKLPVVQSGKVLPPSQKSAEAGGGRSLSKRHAEPSKLTGGGGEQVFDAKVATLAPTLTPAKKPPSKDEQVAKRVTFQEAQPTNLELVPSRPIHLAEEDEDDEESSISEGQLLLPPPTLTSDLCDPQQPLPPSGGAAESASRRNASEWSQSDSDDDDGIVHRLATQGLQRVRVEVACLSLEAESRLCRDVSVVRLFVEFSFLDMPTEETPVSLPKPPPGKSVSFNFSKVIAVDAASSASRRKLLKEVLQGRNPDMERIRFTVVSEPPEEEEQERECEDVGVAFLAIPDLLSQPDDVAHLDLRVVDTEDGVSQLGSLRVSFEGVQTLRAILEESDGELSVAPSSSR
ncbi:protein fantom isoform X3 [Hippocampus comes]|uniref:protein fantom isoform X3 n=1 Tax=Hippocampus comes TaxID=109280 RepID=UPI00094E4338|nr:PREDICTED: protein fantom isoform X3 [Hippocampus comes]